MIQLSHGSPQRSTAQDETEPEKEPSLEVAMPGTAELLVPQQA